MRAARYYGRGDIRVEDVPVPNCGPKQCLVEIEWCGICGSDLHEYLSGPIGIPTPDRPHPLTGGHIPITLGHEFCGRVKTAPPGSILREGQAVMVDPHLVCQGCHCCTSGKEHLCHQLAFLGSSGAEGGGGLSEFVAVDTCRLYPLPDSVSLEFAALIEPLVVAHHVTKTVGIKLKGLDVLIVGGGPIGYAIISVLRAQSVKRIFMSEPTVKRRDQAKDLVERVIDPKNENVGNTCRGLTGGKGADVVFDCAGVQAGLEAAFDALVYGGSFVNVAMWEKPMIIPFYAFFLKEIRILSSCCYNEEDFREVMELVKQGKLKSHEKMVTSRISLEDVITKGFDELVHSKDDHIKILVSPKKHCGME